MKENDYIDLVAFLKATLLGGLFSIMLIMIMLLFAILITKCNDDKCDYNDPKAVIKRERISETDSTETWRTVTYRVVEVRVDTLRKDRTPRSTLDVAPKARVEFPKQTSV